MKILSQIVDTLAHGVILDVTMEDLTFRAYVLVSEPDINRVTELVPKERFDQDGDVHVTAIGHPDDAREQVEDMAFNMNPGDAVVFLCSTDHAYNGTLEELGQHLEFGHSSPGILN